MIRTDAQPDRDESAGTWPRRTADGRTVWACCVSAIGPACQHVATPRTWQLPDSLSRCPVPADMIGEFSRGSDPVDDTRRADYWTGYGFRCVILAASLRLRNLAPAGDVWSVAIRAAGLWPVPTAGE